AAREPSTRTSAERSTHEHAGPPQVRIPECAARRMPNEHAGPPQVRIPECAARRMPNEPPGRSQGEPRNAQHGGLPMNADIVPVCHIVKGEVLTGAEQVHGRFATPRLDLNTRV